ncbi:MAG: HAD-IIIA family hydrolase [bacterium]|nr:HAD-IIIA family hydrolase [bacterium]
MGRGYFDEEQLRGFNAALEHAVGIQFDGIYRCPHTPDEGCDCRKPKPGMLLRAIQEHDIDLEKSYMIGDSMTDIQAGHAAGCTSFFLGNEHYYPEADQTFPSLLAAAQYLR